MVTENQTRLQTTRYRTAWRLVLVILLLGLAGCRGGDTSPTPTPYPTAAVPQVPEYTVQRGDVTRVLEFTGRATPLGAAVLAFQEAGRVYDVFVERDEWVEAGTVLAQLDVEDLLNRLDQARLELQAAEQTYDRALILAELDLESAELRLSSAQAQSHAPAVTIARVDLERAEIALASAQEEYDKALDRPWDPPGTLDAYANGLRQAQWNYEVAQARYDQAVQASYAHGNEIALLEQEVTHAELELEWLEEGAIQQGQQLEAARLELARLEAEAVRSQLIAPFDGQIFFLAIRPGSEVRAFQPIATIGNPETLEITAELSEQQLLDVTIGMTATLEIANRPGDFGAAVVSRLPRTTGPAEDQDPTLHLELLDAEGLSLQIDDAVRVTIVVEQVRNALWLPPQAVRTFEGRRFVVVQDGTTQRRVDVVIGVQGEERIEIISGIEEGQVVIAP